MPVLDADESQLTEQDVAQQKAIVGRATSKQGVDELEGLARERYNAYADKVELRAERAQKATPPIVPSTGELFNQWMARRLQILSDHAPTLSATQTLQFASAAVSNDELEQLARIAGLLGLTDEFAATTPGAKLLGGHSWQELRDLNRHAPPGADRAYLLEGGGDPQIAKQLQTLGMDPTAIQSFIDKYGSLDKAFEQGVFDRLMKLEGAKERVAAMGTAGGLAMGGLEALFAPATAGFKAVAAPFAAGAAEMGYTLQELFDSAVERRKPDIKIGSVKDLPSAVKAAYQDGPGATIAMGWGARRGTAPFSVASLGIDLALASVFDPLIAFGKIEAGLRLAETVPAAERSFFEATPRLTRGTEAQAGYISGKLDVAEVGTHGMPALTRWAYLKNMRTPQELANFMEENGSLQRLYEVAKTSNSIELADRWKPVLGAQRTRWAEALSDAARNGPETFKETLVNSWRGRLPPKSYGSILAREKHLLDDLSRTEAEAEAVGGYIERAVLKQEAEGIRTELESVQEQLGKAKFGAPVRAAPRDTFATDLRFMFKRGKAPLEAQPTLVNAEDGSLTWWHGTPKKFKRFDPDLAGPRVSADFNARLGVHFSTQEQISEGFAGRGPTPLGQFIAQSSPEELARRLGPIEEGGAVLAVGLKMDNPVFYASEDVMNRAVWDYAVENGLVRDTGGFAGAPGSPYRAEEIVRSVEQGHWSPVQALRTLTTENQDEIAKGFREVLRRDGHDGIHYVNDIEGGEAAIAFSKNQIIGPRGSLKAEKITSLTKFFHHIGDSNFMRHVISPIPHGKTFGAELESELENLERGLANVLDMPRDRVDHYLERFKKAGFEEKLEVVDEALKEGASKVLPAELVQQKTQLYQDILNSAFATEGNVKQFVVTKVLADGTVIETALPHLPVVETAREIPMPDWHDLLELKKLRSKMRRAMTGQGEGPVAEWIKSLPTPAAMTVGAAAGAWEKMDRFSTAFIRIWKPTVLFRLAWTAKVVIGDEMARMMAIGTPSLWNHPFEFITDQRAFHYLNKSERLAVKAAELGSEGRLLSPRALQKEINRLRADGKSTASLEKALEYRTKANAYKFLGRQSPIAKRMFEAPDAAIANLTAAFLGERVPTKGTVLRQTERGGGQAFQHELVQLRGSMPARILAREDKAAALAWIEGPEGDFFREELDRLLARKPIWRVGAEKKVVQTYGDWLDTLELRLAEKTKDNPILKEAIASGYLDTPRGRFALDSKKAIKYLKELPAGEAPLVVKNIAENWLVSEQRFGERFSRMVYEYLGSKPTNWLNRRRLYATASADEYTRLVGLGIPEPLAEATAREWGIRQVKDILFDGAERGAFAYNVRNLAPFFPAHQEVMSRWLKVIPAKYGQGLGQAYLLRWTDIYIQEFKRIGGLKQNLEGDWVVSTPLGEFRPNQVVPMMFFTQFPFSGPLHTMALAQLVKSSEKLQALTKIALPFGVDTAVGPRWPNYLLKGFFGRDFTLPWESQTIEVQKNTWISSQIDWMRHQEAKFGRLTKINDITKQYIDPATGLKRADVSDDTYRKAIAQRNKAWKLFVIESEEAASGISLKKGILGFLVGSPRQYWEGQKDQQKFYNSIKALSGPEKSPAYAAFAAAHPDLIPWLTPKTRVLPGELDRIDKYNEISNQIRGGIRDYENPLEWVDIANGDINWYGEQALHEKNLAEIGLTAAEWLRNGAAYKAEMDRHRAVEGRMKEEFPIWYKRRTERITAARRKAGEPDPIYEEKLAGDTASALSGLGVMLALTDVNAETKENIAALRKARGALFDLKLEKYYSDKELPPGPRADVAWFQDAVAGEYWDRIGDLRELSGSAPTPEARSDAFEAMRKWLDAQKPLVHKGTVYPTAEEAAYRSMSSEQQQSWRLQRSLRPLSWLSNFERKQLGLTSRAGKVDEYWNHVNSIRALSRSIIDREGWASSSKQAKNIRATVKAWEIRSARELGDNFYKNEYLVDQMKPYEKARHFGYYTNPDWKRVFQVADVANTVLRQNEVGAGSKLGEALREKLVGWIRDLRGTHPVLSRELGELGDYRPGKVGRTDEDLIDWFIFGVVPFKP